MDKRGGKIGLNSKFSIWQGLNNELSWVFQTLVYLVTSTQVMSDKLEKGEGGRKVEEEEKSTGTVQEQLFC